MWEVCAHLLDGSSEIIEFDNLSEAKTKQNEILKSGIELVRPGSRVIRYPVHMIKKVEIRPRRR